MEGFGFPAADEGEVASLLVDDMADDVASGPLRAGSWVVPLVFGDGSDAVGEPGAGALESRGGGICHGSSYCSIAPTVHGPLMHGPTRRGEGVVRQRSLRDEFSWCCVVGQSPRLAARAARPGRIWSRQPGPIRPNASRARSSARSNPEWSRNSRVPVPSATSRQANVHSPLKV